jgi:hypothetical protein
MRDGRAEGRPRLFNHGRVGRTREILNDLSTENRLPKPRRPVDPQQLWPGGKLRLEPAPKDGSVEDPVARTRKSLLKGVAVPFIWRTTKPEVEFALNLGSEDVSLRFGSSNNTPYLYSHLRSEPGSAVYP